ncbi:hypothetical protein CBM2625_U90006 [Cupriavidus taiwanensis]|nr:hypothetical protein CBM2625_U90006 [Cupriavidus taiwanensis]
MRAVSVTTAAVPISRHWASVKCRQHFNGWRQSDANGCGPVQGYAGGDFEEVKDGYE